MTDNEKVRQWREETNDFIDPPPEQLDHLCAGTKADPHDFSNRHSTCRKCGIHWAET